jgi:hypothetical protein
MQRVGLPVTSHLRAAMQREDIDLVHVIWGDTDQGVVSLKRNAIVFYTFAKQFGGHHSFIPTIGIEDRDFALIMDPVSNEEPDVFEATWDDVPRLLNHPKFPLMLAEFPQGTVVDPKNWTAE